MADFSKLSKLVSGVQRHVDLANNSLLVDNLKIKAGSGNDAFYATFSGSLSAVRTIALPDTNLDFANIAALVTLSGVAANSLDLGTFTGSTIPDSSTVKAALQSLETAVEAGSGTDFADDVFRISDDGDSSKKIAFQASAITASTVRTISMPDANVNLADIATNTSGIADLVTLSGVAANATHLGTFTGAIIPDSSTVKSAFQSLETFIEALPDPMEYKGNYNATTNSPSLADGVGNNGDVYYVSVAGTQDFGSGSITFAVSDRVVYNGADSVWQKWDTTDQVLSVFGRTGAVTAQSGDYDTSLVTENTNLYFTEARVRASVLTGFVSGAGTVSDADSVLSAIQKLNGNNVVTQGEVDALEAVVAANSEKVVRIAALGEATITSGIKAFRWAKAADVGYTAGRFYLADNDASSADNFHVCGLYVAAGTEVITNVLTATKVGKLTATGHGFTIGSPIFLDSSGALTSTAPSTTDLAVVKVGIAEDANTIDVSIEIMGVN